MCVTTPRFMTSSRRRRRQTRRSRRPMILTEGIHHDVTDLHRLLHLVVIAIRSNTNTHELNVVTNVKTIKMIHFNHQNHSIFYPSWRKFKTEVIHPNVSDLHPNISDFPGLLLQVFLAVPSVVDHQLTCTKCCQKCEKKLMSTSITTAYHILDEEKPNWSDTSWFWRPPWSSPPGCPCHPQCRWPPTFMSLMLSNMLKIYNH